MDDRTSNTWKLFAKLLATEPPKLQVLELSSTATVASILARCEQMCAEPASNLSLVHDGAELANEKTLRAAGLADGETVHVICKRRTLQLRSAAPPESITQEAWPASASVARKLRLDAARWRADGASSPGAWSSRDALVRLQRERSETVVPNAASSAVLSAAPSLAAQQKAAEAARKDAEDSDVDEVDAHARVSVDLWPSAELSKQAPVAEAATHARVTTRASMPTTRG